MNRKRVNKVVYLQKLVYIFDTKLLDVIIELNDY